MAERTNERTDRDEGACLLARSVRNLVGPIAGACVQTYNDDER